MREHDMSQQIKEIRKHYGLSQQAFARLLGIGEASITRYEKGIALPRPTPTSFAPP